MDLAIIAAGDSSRMFNEGMQIPKPLIKINGIPIIERIIRVAKNNYLNSVKCIVNDKSKYLRDFLIENDFGIPIKLIVKSTPSSMHSLFALSPLLTDEPFCLTTCDSIFDENEFGDFIRFCKKSQNIDGVLAITDFIDDEKPLYVDLDNDKRILSFKDKDTGQKYVTGGIYYFSPKIFQKKEEALNHNMLKLRNYLRLLIQSGYLLYAYTFSKIIDVDHVSDIKIAEEFIKNRK
jgi:NDP-sugar pyrophosphorylase family protein